MTEEPQQLERLVLVLDTETALIVPGCTAPRLACVSYATPQTYGLLHHTEALECVVAALRSDALLVGHNIAFDMAVICAAWPELVPVVFEVYAADRVTDTLLRDKLIDIAFGHREFGTEGKRRYSLEVVAKRRLNIQLEKDEWRLGYGELLNVPMPQWPEGAKQYAMADAVTTLGVWQHQERESKWLHDQYRQARAAFWLQLMSIWGLHTDEAGVLAFAQKTQQKYDAIAQELLGAGVLRVKRTKKRATGLVETKFVRNTKVVQARIEQACRQAGVQPSRTDKKAVKTDSDACVRSGDPLLQQYADLSSLTTMMSTYLPLLRQGIHTPIHTYFDTLLSTGRTSSSPNVQNLPTEAGVRECFVPRLGKVFAIGDYSGMELRTWAQVCILLFGKSEMAKALNAGADLHTKGAAMILGIPYEQAVAEYAADPYGRVYKPRQAMKAGNFGFPGGAGIARFRDYARSNYGVVLSDQEAKDLKAFWQTTWPESQSYANWIGKQCEANEDGLQIEQVFVRRTRGGLNYTEASNTLFQALAADCAKEAGFLIARACYAEPSSPLYGARPVNFVHDEFVVEVEDNWHAHDAAMELARLMRLGADQYLPDVPSKVEPLLCRRWSKSAKPVHGPDGRLVPWDMEIQ